jgi:DNA polymerase V
VGWQIYGNERISLNIFSEFYDNVPDMKKDIPSATILEVDQKNMYVRPLFTSSVSAGFPSPAEDHIDRKLDLNELLIRHPVSTFFVRVDGDSMKDASINHDDILVVDRSLEAKNGKIVIAIVNGELTVKRLERNHTSCKLVPANPDCTPIVITEDTDFSIWGVVTSVIHQF